MPLMVRSGWQQLYGPALAILFAGATCGLTVGRPIEQSNTWHFSYAETLQFPYPVASTQFQLLFTYILLLITKRFTYLLSSCIPIAPSSEDLLLILDTDEVSRVSPRLRPERWVFFNVLLLAIAITAEDTLRAWSIAFAPLEVFLFSRAAVLPLSMLFILLTGSKFASNRGIFFQAAVLSLGVLMAARRDDLPRLWQIERISFSSAVVAATWPFQFERVVKLLTAPPTRDRTLPEHLGGPNFWRLVRSTSKLSTIVLFPILLLSGELGQIYRNCYLFRVPDFWINLFASAAFQSIKFISSVLFIHETSAFKFAILAVIVDTSQVLVLTYSKLLSSQWLGLFICGLMATCFCCSSIVPISLFDLIDKIPRLFRQGTSKSRRRTLFKIHITAALAVLCLAFSVRIIRMSYDTLYPRQTFEYLSPLSPTSDGSMIILQGNDSYLGRRPDVHAVANIDLLVDECRGTYELMERMRGVQHCLEFLATKQDLYLSIPAPEAPVEKGPEDEPGSGAEICDGPIILYHLWWTGLPSWRTELCMKSYFHTQNLPCSRLWIWINVDQDPEGVLKWMDHSRFQHFIPLVETGAIVIKEWKLPARVPLPRLRDPLDRARYYKQPRPPNAEGEYLIADATIEDASGQEYLQLYDPTAGVQLTYFTVAVSDAARLIILHLHGGVYLDMDIILLRDMRPLVLPGHGFAERWGSYAEAGMYNNALLSLPANSTLSSYLLYGGTRMGLIYHFQALGRMLQLEGRDDVSVGSGVPRQRKAQARGMGLIKWETAFFDPMWAENDGLRLGKCTVPCIPAFEMIFQAASVPREWEVYNGVRLIESDSGEMEGVSNRTMENFYRGAWAYHIHNQWHLQFERGSWIDIITRAHDGFFNGERVNPYGESWKGPVLDRYV